MQGDANSYAARLRLSNGAVGEMDSKVKSISHGSKNFIVAIYHGCARLTCQPNANDAFGNGALFLRDSPTRY